MTKVILLSVIAMSVLVARDCRYEEQELNMLIRQYKDLQDEAEYQGANSNAYSYNQRTKDIISGKDPFLSSIENIERASQFNAKYNFEFNRLNKRIEQQKQRLNNCRNGK